MSLLVQCIKQNQWQIKLVLLESFGCTRECFLGSSCFIGLFGKIAQGPRAPLTQHLDSGFGDGMKKTCNPAGLVADGAEREREESLFQIAVALQKHALVFEERRFPLPCPLKWPTDRRPSGSPTLRIIHSHGGWMLVCYDHSIAIVVDLDMAWPPHNVDGKIGRQTEIYGGPQ